MHPASKTEVRKSLSNKTGPMAVVHLLSSRNWTTTTTKVQEPSLEMLVGFSTNNLESKRRRNKDGDITETLIKSLSTTLRPNSSLDIEKFVEPRSKPCPFMIPLKN